MSMADGYRPDIDGLRALAVLPVLLFHAGVPGFSGGYVGVDVFFVISGYLITGIIAREIDAGRFSIVAFYERRARRIMPALIVVIAAVLIAAGFVYLPGDFEDVPRSALAATLFVSNVHFFLETGYFQGGAETRPLLHTWSLAIEEQFYILFPLFLILLARHAPRWRTGAILVVLAVSFAIAVVTQADGTGFAFYLLPARGWELMVGALLALRAPPPVPPGWRRETVAAAGLAAIGFAVISFDAGTVFPGAAALFPVLGAASLIHAAPGTWVGRLLSSRPFTGTGLISYSLYLWHWPIVVFVHYVTDSRPAGWTTAAIILASLVVAVLSWRFIETPFRRRDLIGRRGVFATMGAGMAALCLTASAMVMAGAWPARYSPEVARLAQARHDVSPYRDRCHDTGSAYGRQPCVLGAKAPPTALLWGDSHGVEYAFALSRMAERNGWSLIQRTASSCPPVLYAPRTGGERCAAINREVLEQIRTSPELGTIFLAALWPVNRQDSAMVQGLEDTLATLAKEGRRVVLIGPVPGNGFDVPRHLAHLAQRNRLAEARGADRAEIEPVERWMRAIAARWPDAITYVSAADAICDERTCRIIQGGSPLYFDSHHPSVSAARLVLARLDDRVAPGP